jgi:RNA polymerase sigma-70 factor (ECF subfamily)
VSTPGAPDETAMRSAFEENDFAAVATTCLKSYGDEILSFITALVRNEADAGDVFGQFAEDLWNGLPRFEWRTTLRAWAYTLARHAAIRFKKAAHRKPGRNVSLTGEIDHLVQSVRSRTALHLRTETKSKMRELREKLPGDDQALIILRIDRGLSWRELVEVLSEESPESAGARDKEEARLRKRFQLAKEKLVEMAREAGLLDGSKDET